jgi:hypothetical protein
LGKLLHCASLQSQSLKSADALSRNFPLAEGCESQDMLVMRTRQPSPAGMTPEDLRKRAGLHPALPPHKDLF